MRIFIISVLAILMFAILPTSAYAQDTAIGVVDIRYIMNESSAAKSIQKQRTDMQTKFLSEISGEEKTLRDEEQTLLKAREGMDPDEFLKRKQDYERKLLDTGKRVREKKQALEEALGNAMMELQNKLSVIVAELAKEKGYNLVITKQNVIVGSDEIDLTQPSLEKLNAELKNITLKTTP